MKQAFVIMACLIMALGAVAQEEVKIEITSFEDGQDWAYTGDSIYQSEVQTAGDVEPQDGDHMLFVEYDNFGGAWNWSQLDFHGEAYDLTEMTEIHMWVYYNDLAPDLTIQLQASSFDPKYDINLGNQTIEKKDAWQEMVWKIDPITAQKLVNVDHFGGFIDPGQQDRLGMFYLDNIFAVKPAGITGYEIVTLNGFNTEDDFANFNPSEDHETTIEMGSGQVEPAEGDNYAVLSLKGSWVINGQLNGMLGQFDRWDEVEFIAWDMRTAEDLPGGWLQTMPVLQSAENSWDQQWDLRGIYSDVQGEWETLIFETNMEEHAPVFSEDYEGAWWLITIVTNGAGDQDGMNIYMDNFRVIVPKQETPVLDWSLF